MTPLDDPLAAWRALAASEAAVADGVGLHLPGAAVLLANAVWRPDPTRLDEAAAWCRAKEIPDAIVVDGADALRRSAALEAGYRRSVAFERVGLRAAGGGSGACDRVAGRAGDTSADTPGGGLLVEQVAFGSSHAAGLLLAKRYRQPQNAVPIATALADALRRAGTLVLWLAYRGDDPAGALLAHRGEAPGAPWSGLLEAGAADAQRALGVRLAAAAAAEGRSALRWVSRGGHGALPARGVVRLERGADAARISARRS